MIRIKGRSYDKKTLLRAYSLVEAVEVMFSELEREQSKSTRSSLYVNGSEYRDINHLLNEYGVMGQKRKFLAELRKNGNNIEGALNATCEYVSKDSFGQLMHLDGNNWLCVSCSQPVVMFRSVAKRRGICDTCRKTN